MLVTINLIGDKELIARFGELAPSALQALSIKVRTLSLQLQAWVQTKKLNGQVLNRRTGALSRSIFQRVEVMTATVYGYVYSSGDVKYAGIHEYGGVIHHPGGTAYIVDPKRAAGMIFVSNKVATPGLPRTAPHDIHMPERSYLRSSLREMSTTISLGMKEAVINDIRSKVSGR